VLTVDTIPLFQLPIVDFQLPIWTLGETFSQSTIGNRQLEISLGLFMIRMFAATATKLPKPEPIRRGLLILCRYVVAALAVVTLKNNIIARHIVISDFQLPIGQLRLRPPCFKLAIGNRKSTLFPIPQPHLSCRRPLSGHLLESRIVTPSPSRSA
jgi:hypothetical protein